MIFHQYLQHVFKKNGIRQIELLSQLQSSHSIFSGLDAITLSRWCNNKTIPSYKKQLLISKHFERDLSYFIQHIDHPKITKVFLKMYDTLFNKLETSYARIGYLSIDNGPATLSMLNLTTETHRKLFGVFYKHMEAYRFIYSKLDQNNVISKNCVFTIKQGVQIVSHLGFVEDMTTFSRYFKKKLPTQPTANSIVINVGHFSCRNYFESLIGHLFNHLVDSYWDIEECYIATRRADFLIFWEQMGGTQLLSVQESRFVGNVYIVQFNLKQLLASPFIFLQIQRTYLSYLKLKQHLTIPILVPCE